MALTVSQLKKLNFDLIEGALRGEFKEVARCLEEGADTEATDRHGYTAISEAAIAGHTAVVGYLLRALADPNHVAPDGRTALHRAAFHGWVPVCKLLLENGADPSIKDANGVTASGLARKNNVRELIDAFPLDCTERLIQERQEKLAKRPARPDPIPDPEESEAEKAAKKAKEEAERKAREEAEAKKKAPIKDLRSTRPKLSRKEKEKRYQEAMAELLRDGNAAAGMDSADAAALEYLPKVSMARIEVMGAGEERCNGLYMVSFISRDRVEFEKVDDEACQVFWCEHHNEWRILIGDYKMGNVLYRNAYRPNLKADECHGAPEMEWQVWFGKGPEPIVMRLPFYEGAEGEGEEAEGQQESAKEQADTAGKGADAAKAAADGSSAGGNQQAPPTAEPPADAQLSSREQQKRAEFLELHPRLKVINTDETGFSRRDRDQRPLDGQKIDVALSGSSSRIVETSDGLFGADEVEEEVDIPLNSSGGAEGHALAWLNGDTGEEDEVEPTWPDIHEAKAEAQQLFKSGKMTEARQRTSSAIKALQVLERIVRDMPMDIRMAAAEVAEHERLEAAKEGRKLEPTDVSPDYVPSHEEMDRLGGILYSNRSLLLLQLIQAEDREVLAYGVEAAWRLVVKDADAALAADALNFKASFRRAQALFELGELTEALSDATRVVDHYSMNSSSPNPEAAALRERILEAVRLDARKWGSKKRPAWNRGTGEALVTEMDGSAATESLSSNLPQTPWQPRAVKAVNGYAERNIAAAPARTLQAPKTAADVEKTLLVQLKNDAERRKTYVEEHIPAESIKKLYKRAPLGPDLLATLITALRDLAREDVAGAGSRLSALAACPSATTHAAMFDAKETAALRELVDRLGPEAVKTWLPERQDDDE
eukprot:TRINITY_DN80988_c0_g1_i1.p1 TRINITY_DN80988_c0_g1~~TRINITY_DN80988_c0_g1_i1.p1  ORF type:complete len:918 (+),score=272.69 TRINITY_DN80988_c0_g1_i1:102-2756(+)